MGSSPLTRGKHGCRRPRGGWRRLIPAHAGKTSAVGYETTVTWAHPRSRGENVDEARQITVLRGSSPLTRGKL